MFPIPVNPALSQSDQSSSRTGGISVPFVHCSLEKNIFSNVRSLLGMLSYCVSQHDQVKGASINLLKIERLLESAARVCCRPLLLHRLGCAPASQASGVAGEWSIKTVGTTCPFPNTRGFFCSVVPHLKRVPAQLVAPG